MGISDCWITAYNAYRKRVWGLEENTLVAILTIS
jgi:hypothetical protein